MEQLKSMNFIYFFVTILSLLLLYLKVSKKGQPAPFPPGPRPLPFIGNLRDMPKTQAYRTFLKWSKIYGDIVHVNVLGNRFIILNSPKYVAEMLDAKSRLYSDRPTLMMAGKLVGWEGATVCRPFDDNWAQHRRLMANFMGTHAKVAKFESVIREGVKKLLSRIVTSPEKQLEHFQNYAGPIVLMLIYGYEAAGENDLLVRIVNDAVNNFGETTRSGGFVVDYFPMLRFVPGWFPGAGWKRKAAIYREQVNEMLERPYEWTREQMKLGTSRSCFLTNALEEGADRMSKEQEKLIQWAAATLYAGGAHTTAASLSCFLLGIVRHSPELHRAQAEIQEVVGNDRLPTLADREHLPYFEALCMEIHRCYSIIPLSFYHVAREDDIHDGYFIPKGTMVLGNNMSFYRNKKLYPNPSEFSPERFLEFDADGRRKQKDPRDFLFGYGRRRCPGIYFADATLWLASAALLTVFDFKPALKDGKPAIPQANFVGEVITHPEPFNCVITPRSKFSDALLESF